MQVAEHIEAIATRCRTLRFPLPESLVTAICQYLAGNGTLSVIQQEWKTAVQKAPYYYSVQFINLAAPNPEHLDEIDLRILDICIAISTIGPFLQAIAGQ